MNAVCSRNVLALAPFVLGMGVGLAGCSGYKVRSDFDPGANLEDRDTYAWTAPLPQPSPDSTVADARLAESPPPGGPIANADLLAVEIQRAVDNQLAAKGMRRVSRDSTATADPAVESFDV